MKFKAGLALAAALVVSLAGAAGAVAAPEEFKGTSSPATLRGENVLSHTFTIEGTAFSCGEAVFEKGSQALPSKTIAEVKATYTSCSTPFLIAEVDMGTCRFELLQPDALIGKLAIRCAPGGFIRIKESNPLAKCEVLIGEAGNTSLSKVEYENVSGSPTTVNATANVSGITATKATDQGSCTLAGTGTVTNMTYKGTIALGATGGVGFSIG